MNSIIYYFVLLMMTILGAFASFFLKKAASKANLIDIAKTPFLYIGGGMYVLAAVLNIWLLYYLPYSTVLPMTSITYIWTMLISYFLLKEKIGVKKVLGIVLIILGIFLIAFAVGNQERKRYGSGEKDFARQVEVESWAADVGERCFRCFDGNYICSVYGF